MANWDKRFLRLAREVSTWSKDPSSQVGAVIVDWDKRILSVGFNGFPKGIADTDERLTDRSIKYPMIIHAEINAILLANTSVKCSTLYIWPFMPCVSCAAIIIQSGISRVVAPKSDNEKWGCPQTSIDMFKEANITLDLVDELY
jgi:dCMP deaminase